MDTPLTPLAGMKFGCDPELFVFNPQGQAVSAAGLLPGTKEEPYVVDCGAIQVDGMAAEFNINPAVSFDEWDRNISTVLKTLGGMLPKGHALKAVPSVTFDKTIFAEAPEEAKILGCSSDINAWTGEVNPPPDFPANPLLRTAAGHIHIGWTEGAELGDIQHMMNCRDLVKQLDWYLGGWSLRMDADPARRNLYGKAGAMRPKTYGVEYRVLSNFWIMTKANRLAVWNRLQQAIIDIQKKFMPDTVGMLDNEYLQSSINSSFRNSKLESKHAYPLSTLDPGKILVSKKPPYYE